VFNSASHRVISVNVKGELREAFVTFWSWTTDWTTSMHLVSLRWRDLMWRWWTCWRAMDPFPPFPCAVFGSSFEAGWCWKDEKNIRVIRVNDALWWCHKCRGGLDWTFFVHYFLFQFLTPWEWMFWASEIFDLENKPDPKTILLYFEWAPPWHFKTTTIDFMSASSPVRWGLLDKVRHIFYRLKCVRTGRCGGVNLLQKYS